MGSAGALLLSPEEIGAWMREFREGSNGAVQLNLWIPDPPPVRDPVREATLREFLGDWGPPCPPIGRRRRPPDFAAQCEALLAAGAARCLLDHGPLPAGISWTG